MLKAFPRNGGKPISICASCFLKWTRDQRHLFFSFPPGSADNGDDLGETFIIKLPRGRALPDIPAGGFESAEQMRKIPNVRVIAGLGLFPGPTATRYAYQRESARRNLYWMKLPR